MVAQTMGPLLVVAILEGGRRPFSLADVSGVVRLVFAGAIGMLPVAVIATAVNDANQYVAGGNWLHFGADWWVGDTMGVLLVTPFVVGLRSWKGSAEGRWVEIALSIAAAAVGTRLLFSGTLPLMFLVFPFTLWAALRFSPPVIATVNVVVAGIAIWTTAEGYGPFSGVPGATSLVLLESFNGAVAITSLVLGAAVTTVHQLARENDRLHAEVRSQLDEVTASRSRIVESAYRERRRVERDLHDGAQQRLVSLAYSLGLTLSRSQPGTDTEARVTLARSLDEVRLTLSELRSLAQGIHPAVLTQGGLGAALESLAEQATLPVAVQAPGGRFPAVIEAAAYFVVSESLTNVAKHANARAARVSVTETVDELIIEVVDDGRGGADPEHGSGLIGLVDRISGLNGRLHIDSPLGGGTRIRAVLPCDWS
jgi:signal transduction histidine kinase